MADINHEIKIEATPDAVLKALCDVKDLKAWHTAHIDTENGALRFKATGRPAFLWKIVPGKGDGIVTWECLEGPGDSKGTKAVYSLSKEEDGRTLVELAHVSWPDQEGNFRKCNTLWGALLHHLKDYLETGKSSPAIP